MRITFRLFQASAGKFNATPFFLFIINASNATSAINFNFVGSNSNGKTSWLSISKNRTSEKERDDFSKLEFLRSFYCIFRSTMRWMCYSSSFLFEFSLSLEDLRAGRTRRSNDVVDLVISAAASVTGHSFLILFSLRSSLLELLRLPNTGQDLLSRQKISNFLTLASHSFIGEKDL